MTDLFSDPILLIPVIAILVIFGGFYITAMIWSYNRDAKKQGKKSGCLPVVMLVLSLSVLTGCYNGMSREIYGSYDDIWNAVVNAEPWFSEHPEAFHYKSGKVRMANHEIGTFHWYEIDIKPHKPGPPRMHRVRVHYKEWTPSIVIPPPPRPAYMYQTEEEILSNIESAVRIDVEQKP